MGDLLVDDDNGRRTAPVGGGEGAAPSHGHVHDAEILWCDAPMSDLGVILTRRTSVDNEVARVARAGQWGHGCRRGANNSWKRRRALRELIEKGQLLRGRIVLLARQHDLGREHAMRVEAGIDLYELAEAPHKETGA